MNADADGALSFAALQPHDRHDRALLEHAHPSGWVSPVPKERYHMVVVGGGTAGLVTAAGAAGLGARVALVERALLGGDCLNVGCVPSKALIRAARALADVRGAARFGVVAAGDVRADFGTVMERMRAVRAELSSVDSAQRFAALGVDVFFGAGRFIAPDAVQVGEHTLRFVRACIATGSRPAVPAVPGLPEVGYRTNETVFGLCELPRRLGVVGGGPIGVELAQAFARLGSEVSLIERGARLLARDDRDAAAVIERALRRDGVRLRLESTLQSVAAGAHGKRLSVRGSDEAHDLDVDEILIAAGRAPNVEDLGLAVAGVEHDAREGVHVDDRLRTSNERIFAAGDVCTRLKFTHAADAMARVVIQNALFFGRRKASSIVMPWCTYTDPELAHVGLHAEVAAAENVAIETETVPLASVDRAVLEGDDEGFLRLHRAAGSDRIVGATMVGRHAGETISVLTTAMVAGVGLRTIADVVHPYPTRADAIRKAADAYNRTRLTPRAKRLLGWLLALHR